MNRPELYQKTVDILVQAYFNDTLQHANCHACAVGNIIAANMNIRLKEGRFGVIEWEKGVPGAWYRVIAELRLPSEMKDTAAAQIDSTKYTALDLRCIEHAFERARGAGDEKMFNGLMAVIEALDAIHDNKDDAVTEASKKKFNRNTTVA